MKESIGEVKYLCKEITLQVLSVAVFCLLSYKFNMNIYLASILGTTIFLTCTNLCIKILYMKIYRKIEVNFKDVIYQYKFSMLIYLLEIVVIFFAASKIGLNQVKILYSIFILIFNLYNKINFKIFVKWFTFIGIFPLIAILIEGNNIGDMYVKNPLTLLGVVTGGITALITMLIFMVNFNVNDIYLGRSKSKVYLEDRILIKFFNSAVFKLTFFVFLVVTLKLCGIVFKTTYIYKTLMSIKLLNYLLNIIEKYYKDAGVFSFLLLSLTILLAIMGNIEQLFHTMKFKEDEMVYLKRKIEQSIGNKYRRLLEYEKSGKYFFQELKEEYEKIKHNEGEKFLQVVFEVIHDEYSENYSINFISEMTPEELNKFFNNKYKWIQENVCNKEILNKNLLVDVLSLSYLGKDEYYIRMNLIEKFIELENQEDWKFICSLMEEILTNNRVNENTEFVKYVLKKVIRTLVKIDKLEDNKLYKLLKKKMYNIELEMLKNESIVMYLYDQHISYLDRSKYKELINLLSEEYKISWALYKIFEEKYKWSKDVEFAFEVLRDTSLEKVESYYSNIIENTVEQKKSNKALEIILSILDQSRLHYRMRNKYEFIFDNLKRELNYEFEEILINRDINIFKFILIRDWVHESYLNYYFGELKYFSENMDNISIIRNIFNKLSLYVSYRIIEQNRYITGIIYKLIEKYSDVIIESIYNIDDWKVLMYLEGNLDKILEVHFKTNNENIRNDSTLAYFNILLDKEKYKELYTDKKFKKQLYKSLSEYMRRNNKTLEETINKFKQYRNLSELEERVLRREIDDVLIV